MGSKPLLSRIFNPRKRETGESKDKRGRVYHASFVRYMHKESPDPVPE